MKTYIIPSTAVSVLSSSLMQAQAGSPHEANIEIGGKTSEQTEPIVPF